MVLFRIVFTLIHLGIVSLLILTAANEYVSPLSFPYLNLLSLAFPGLLMGHILLTLVWILSWRKRALLFLLATLVFIAPIRRWINYPTEKTTRKADLKVLSFNTKTNQYGLQNVQEVILKHDPDIIMLQEAGYKKMERLESDQHQYAINYPVISFLSKHKILRSGDVLNLENGHAMYADVEINGEIIRFLNVYLEPFYLQKKMILPGEDLKESEIKYKQLILRLVPTFRIHQLQIAEVKKMVKDSPYPVILGGDFNAVPTSFEYFALKDGLQDPFTKVGEGLGTSFHDYKFPIRIDYIFHSSDIQPVSYITDRSVKVSDHYPVIASFSLK